MSNVTTENDPALLFLAARDRLTKPGGAALIERAVDEACRSISPKPGNAVVVNLAGLERFPIPFVAAFCVSFVQEFRRRFSRSVVIADMTRAGDIALMLHKFMRDARTLWVGYENGRYHLLGDFPRGTDAIFNLLADEARTVPQLMEVLGAAEQLIRNALACLVSARIVEEKEGLLRVALPGALSNPN